MIKVDKRSQVNGNIGITAQQNYVTEDGERLYLGPFDVGVAKWPAGFKVLPGFDPARSQSHLYVQR